MTTKLFRTPSSDPGIGMLARPIVPAVQESRRVVAESLRGNAVKIAVATDGQVLRWRAASNSLEPEALPGSASTVNVKEDGALKGVSDTFDFLEPDASLITFGGAQSQIDMGLYILKAGGRAFTGDQSMGGNKLTSLGAPTAANDAARKGYVDAKKVSKTLMFHYPDEDMAVGDFVPESAIRVPAAGKHGTWTPGTIYVRCLTAGTGTNTVLFRTSSTLTGARTTRATVNLGTNREASAAITWTPADGEYTWTECSEVGATAPKRVVAQVDGEETVY